MSSNLTTRDGREVKGIGSWEQEQLRKDKRKPPEIVDSVKKNSNPELKNLARPMNTKRERICWEVKIIYNCKAYPGQKKFYDRDYGGEDGAKQAAIEYRDKKRAEYGLPLIEKRNETI